MLIAENKCLKVKVKLFFELITGMYGIKKKLKHLAFNDLFGSIKIHF